MEDIVIVGFGGHAKSIIDALESQGKYHIIGFTDIVERPSYKGYNYLGTDDVLPRILENGVKYAHIAIGFIGQGKLRDKLYGFVKEIGFSLPVIVDSSAVVASDAHIDEGCFVGKNAVVNANAKIGKMCIINTGAIIEHDCKIAEFSHIAVGTTLCGEVFVGNHSFIGAGATIIQGRNVGEECIIGAGSIVLKNIDYRSKVYGVVK